MAILTRLRRDDTSRQEGSIGRVVTNGSRQDSIATVLSTTSATDGRSSIFQKFRRANKNTIVTAPVADDVLATSPEALDSRKMTFFDLPPELRNVVYEDVASTTMLSLPATLSSPSSSFSPASRQRKTIVEPHGLLLASKKCRQEFLPLLFSSAQVKVEVRDFYFKPLMRVTGSLYSTELKALRENASLVIVLRTHNCAQENLATLRKWLVNRSHNLDKLPWSYEVELAPTEHVRGRVRQMRELSLYAEELGRMEGRLEESLQWELTAIIDTFRQKCRDIEDDLSQAGVEVPVFSAAHIRGLSGGGLR